MPRQTHETSPQTRKAAVSDAELLVLVDAALAAWDGGLPTTCLTVDGARWHFEVKRSEKTGLVVRCEGPGVDPGARTMEIAVASGAELAREDVRHMLASRLLAIAVPV